MVVQSAPPVKPRQAMSFNPAGGGIYVLLRPRADAAAFTRQAIALAARYEVGNAQVVHLATTYAAAQRSIRPQGAALAIFAGLAGLIALAIMGQLLGRQLVLDSAEFPILRALGMSRSGLVVLSLARVAAVTTAGAAIAVGVAIAASPLMPIGPAGFAEPDPGVEINLAVLGAGFVLAAATPLLVVAPAALRVAGDADIPVLLVAAVIPVTLVLANAIAAVPGWKAARIRPGADLAQRVAGGIGIGMARPCGPTYGGA